MEGKGVAYEFIDDRRTNGVDKVNEELQGEDYEEKRRHVFLVLNLRQ